MKLIVHRGPHFGPLGEAGEEKTLDVTFDFPEDSKAHALAGEDGSLTIFHTPEGGHEQTRAQFSPGRWEWWEIVAESDQKKPDLPKPSAQPNLGTGERYTHGSSDPTHANETRDLG